MKTALLIVLSLGLCALALVDPKQEVDFFVPQGWPKPHYNFENNPVSNEGFELGRSLFYDPILSKDSTVSCASCHLQFTAFAHVDHPTSHGVDSRVGKRNAPGLMNLAWTPYFHWDGGVLSLNGQAVNPITHPDEMGSDLGTVLYKLKRQKEYVAAFKKVFGIEDIKTQHVLKALAQFTVSLVSYNSEKKWNSMSKRKKDTRCFKNIAINATKNRCLPILNSRRTALARIQRSLIRAGPTLQERKKMLFCSAFPLCATWNTVFPTCTTADLTNSRRLWDTMLNLPIGIFP